MKDYVFIRYMVCVILSPNHKPACCAQRPSLYGRQVIFNNKITIFKTTIAFDRILQTIYYETDI